MADITRLDTPVRRPETSATAPLAPSPSIVALGMSLSVSFAVTYVLFVLFDLWFPEQATHEAWSPFLPGFSWLTWPGFLLGLAESVAYGWYAALLFGLLYKYFVSRIDRRQDHQAKDVSPW